MSVPTYNNAQVDVRIPAIYNPSEVIGLFSEALAKRSDGVIFVRGIYHPGRGISYNGYFFDILKEEFVLQVLRLSGNYFSNHYWACSHAAWRRLFYPWQKEVVIPNMIDVRKYLSSPEEKEIIHHLLFTV